ncbi:MAG: primosomal protein N', partial [Abditibacteriota bacterium]|nr:primosomal protein N' [Abditibacteriota bacterium]
KEAGKSAGVALLKKKTGRTENAVKMLLRDMLRKGLLEKKYYFAHKPRRLSVKCAEAAPDFSGNITPRMKELRAALLETGRVPVSYLVKNKIASYALIKKCAACGAVTESLEYVDRMPSFVFMAPPEIAYTPRQQEAISRISSLMDGGHATVLLHGVTASGKTEVYMALIAKAVCEGRTALVLLPEIALTSQVMNIFRSRFGDLVAVLHSNLSDGERLDEWQRVRDGRARIVLGARSCVFAPAENIGIIIIDEEHDAGYKQDNSPRYHARDVAALRAEKNGCVLVLGSATPSVESYYKAEKGEYVLVKMPERIEGRTLPQVKSARLSDVSDMGATVFTRELRSAIKSCLDRKQQIILMQNRRAFSTFVLCRGCGWVAKCKNCDVSLKYHKETRLLSCHHCGYSAKAPRACPECGSERLIAFGIGTEKVMEYARREFPGARCIRMDSDTTRTKEAHQKIISAFRNREYDILVGTQMIAKGLDFPGVTLVGIISADADLNMPDFRAEERTFQLLSQVAGRAGRGGEPGEVIIQSVASESPVLKMVARHDYEGFYRYELENRRELMYPPFSRLIRIQSQDRDRDRARRRLEDFADSLRRCAVNKNGKTKIYPVIPAPLEVINNIYHYNLLIKTAAWEETEEGVLFVLKSDPSAFGCLQFDPDPVF